MSARGRARKRALDILYQADLRGTDPRAVLGQDRERRETDSQPDVNEWTVTLVDGVCQHVEHIDELLATYSMGWTVARMPAVDRAILRIGAYEILWRDDIPDDVAISEAVGLAAELSTDDSSGFVNGILARLAQVKPTLLL